MTETFIEGVPLSSPDKVLYPEQGITKIELAEHYVAVADRMLPHVAFRPVTMVRCPTGRQRKCFYQRHAGSGVLEQLKEIRIPGFDEPYLYVTDLPGLIALVQMGTLEIHPWGVRVEKPDRPDRVIFDLDPGEGVAFGKVVEGAIELRERLLALSLESFVKTTGGKGLHVVLPIEPVSEWRIAKAFAKLLSERIAADAPDRFLTKIAKAEREGRIFIDYLRNDPTSTAVGPYSTRSRPGAPVAMPLRWEDLKPSLDPAGFTVRNVQRHLRSAPDPWAGIGEVRQRLPDPATL